MKLVCEIDFSPLTPEEKVEFVHDLRDSMAQSFQEQPPSVQMLAHALIFTRWWNSYRHMAPKEPAPEILGIAIEVLWDFLEGKRGREEFVRFQQSFSDSALDILTGDGGGLNEDPESRAFYEKYFSPWRAMSYNVFLSDLGTVLEEAVSEHITWDAVEGVIYGDIGDTMIVFLEPVRRDAADFNLKRWEKEVYSTPTFARVIALLQQDMRTALEGRPLAELREQYQNEYLFSPEESAKISDYR